MPNPTKKRYKGQKDLVVEEPILGMLMSSGEVKIEPEKGRLHQHIWGEFLVQKAMARFRYDPSTKTLMWTDRDSPKDPEIFYAVVNAVENRGYSIEKHSVMGGGVLRNTPDQMVMAFNLRRFLIRKAELARLKSLPDRLT